MSEYEQLLYKINLLEYHQKLLIKYVQNPKLEFYKLIVEKGLTEQETSGFFKLCEELSKKLEEQKAEGYVYFHPLFHELSISLPSRLNINDVVKACLVQNLFEPLFNEFKRYL